jgi:2-isopropylmalate synthase
MAVEILDTTFRDGAQGGGIRLDELNLEESAEVLSTLDKYADIIEAGFAGASKTIDERFQYFRNIPLERASLAAFGMTRKPYSDIADARRNRHIRKLEDAATPIVTIVGKASDYHVLHALNTDLEENLRMNYDTIRYFSEMGKRVIFDAELITTAMLGIGEEGGRNQFLWKPNMDYALKVLAKAAEAGSDTLVLCDTTGVLPVERVEELMIIVMREFGNLKIGFHGHGDSDLATANTMLAIRHGAKHAQAVANGYGERIGNTNLFSLLVNLSSPYSQLADVFSGLETMTQDAQRIHYLATGEYRLEKASGVGTQAFFHKGGMHGHAMEHAVRAYEGRDLDFFGNTRVFPVSQQGGISHIAQFFGLKRDDPLVKIINERRQEEETRGMDFEFAPASLYVLGKRCDSHYQRPFEVKDAKVVDEWDEGKQRIVGSMDVIVAGELKSIKRVEGRGQVDALTNALKTGLGETYSANQLRLYDFRVHIVPGQNPDTSQTVRVEAFWATNGQKFVTMGISYDIVRASMDAIIDGIEYNLRLPNKMH